MCEQVKVHVKSPHPSPLPGGGEGVDLYLLVYPYPTATQGRSRHRSIHPVGIGGNVPSAILSLAQALSLLAWKAEFSTLGWATSA